MNTEINPFDLLSGKVVQNGIGTFYFKEAGVNVDDDGHPITENLHRENNLPAALWVDGDMWWYVDGKKHRIDGPAIVWTDGYISYYIDGKGLTKKEFNEYVRNKSV